MTFVMLDNKEWCKGIYHKGQLHYDNIPQEISKTWKYATFLKNKKIKYASLYTHGKTMSEVCPDNMKQRWETYTKKLMAYHKSFKTSKIDLEENCFFDLVPQQFLLELCEQKVKIIDFVISNFEKPENYEHLLEIQKLITSISERKLKLNFNNLPNSLLLPKNSSVLTKLKFSKPYVSYNMFGTKTGRLTTINGTFPILTLKKEFRKIIEPSNDLFVEFDYNAAELRTLISLSGESQPLEDIHEWNSKRLGIDREAAKQQVFAWLYGSKKVDYHKFEKIFSLDKIFCDQYNDFEITNYYKRKIQTDKFHKLNYLIQSTTSDLVLKQICDLQKSLNKTGSFVSFIVHDSVVLDLKKEDLPLVRGLAEQFSKTDLGYFPVRISAGKNYKDLKKIN